MLFTDLDRTIIFSTRFVSGDQEIDLIPVEEKEGRVISYVSPSALSLLSKLQEQSSFIPVTARKYEEIMRISFIRKHLPEWMICESGRVIYHNGERLKEWDKVIEQEINTIHQEVLNAQMLFRQILEQKHECKVWHINEEMIMAKTAGMPEEAYVELKEQEGWFLHHGCRLYLQQRKAYLIPTIISKDNAVEFLIDKLQPSITISAGDADMDAGMFEKTTFSIAPKHHTIENNDLVQVTKETGFHAGIEILTFALERLYQKR